jgi:arginyl-tRNA synthetase
MRTRDLVADAKGGGGGRRTCRAADLSLLDEEELALIKLAAQFPAVVEGAAAAHEPHRIAFYLSEPRRRLSRAVEPRQR